MCIRDSFITQLTGITNTMVAAAPDAREVMREAARFVGDTPTVSYTHLDVYKRQALGTQIRGAARRTGLHWMRNVCDEMKV